VSLVSCRSDQYAAEQLLLGAFVALGEIVAVDKVAGGDGDVCVAAWSTGSAAQGRPNPR